MTDPTELHPELTPERRRELFLRGIELFNRGARGEASAYYDAHEAWEEIWRSTTPEPRDLFQGLIQVTVGMYHWLDREKAGPARRVLARGRRRLERFAPRHHGLDIGGLLESVRDWEAWLSAPRGEAPRPPVLEVVDPTGVA